MSEAWIETSTGTKFDLLDPTPEMILIEDIAHSLSQGNRFTGHCRFPYPVAQHSRIGSYLFDDPKLAFRFLLHDASEAYLNDMSRPLKHFTPVGIEYRKVEGPLQEKIYAKFGIFGADPDIIHEVDAQMLYAEKAALMPSAQMYHKWSRDERAADVTIIELSFYENKKMFLDRFNELYNKQ